ncbi:hypothetical protein QFX18_13880 [Saccharophagus degradans]|uniref:hypothetical protein n=1 Tax=Saccharophagus degradans TaxID=86304 RepID=UPI0024782D9C|nr:hypothetical protein [Saccharophagus degradans]WGO97131.1 hypothetical protein QFX18_13880 [Saccharophagus degradans]
MVIDWVIVASVITVLLLLWLMAYAGVYAFKHVALDSGKQQTKGDTNPKAN